MNYFSYINFILNHQIPFLSVPYFLTITNSRIPLPCFNQSNGKQTGRSDFRNVVECVCACSRHLMYLLDTCVSMHLLSSHKATIINNDKSSKSKSSSNNNEMHYYYQQKYTTKEWGIESGIGILMEIYELA